MELLRTRRSRRQFTKAEIPIEAVLSAVEAAGHAPSGANAQPWEFLLIPKGPFRGRIEQMCRTADERFHTNSPQWMKQFFADQGITSEKIYFEAAPWLVAVFSRRDAPYWLPSVWLAIANFINHIHAMGYGTVVWTPTLSREFNDLVGVDGSWSCQAVLPIGLPDDSERIVDRPRLAPEQKCQVLTENGAVGVSEWVGRSD